MIASFTKWDNSLSGTLLDGPMGVPLSEVSLYISECGSVNKPIVSELLINCT